MLHEDLQRLLRAELEERVMKARSLKSHEWSIAIYRIRVDSCAYFIDDARSLCYDHRRGKQRFAGALSRSMQFSARRKYSLPARSGDFRESCDVI